MNSYRRTLISALLSAAAVCLVLPQAQPVEARTVFSSTALPQRFFAELAVANSSSFGQAAATGQDSKGSSPAPVNKGKVLTETICTGCHSSDLWSSQHHTKDEWDAVIDDMISKGLGASDDDLKLVNEYLTTNFGPVKKDPQSASPDASPTAPPK